MIKILIKKYNLYYSYGHEPLPQNKSNFRKYKNLINCKLSDFENIGILGTGSFARVSLEKSINTGTTYPLKKNTQK